MKPFEIISEAVETKGDAILWENEAYQYYDSGLTRAVYISPDRTKVIKIEKVKGMNKAENDIYTNASEHIKAQFAHTTIVSDIIVQEFCEPVKFSDKKMTLKQMVFASSCRGDVGWNSKGELVCFDLEEFKKY